MKLEPVERIPEIMEDVAVLVVAADMAVADRLLVGVREVLGQTSEVRHVVEGRDALEVLEEREFNLILADLNLPSMSGSEMFQGARFQQPDAVRVLVTDEVGEGEVVEAINSGRVYRVLTTPWSQVELNQCIRNALDWGEHGRAMRRLLGEQQRAHRALAASLSRMERAQRQTIHVERLATVGRLTSGIIHEVRNQLTGLRGVLSALEEEGRAEETFKRGRELMKQLTGRCASIESFARGGGWAYEMEELTAGEILDQIQALYQLEIGRPGLLIAVHPQVREAHFYVDVAKLAHAVLAVVVEGHGRFNTPIRLRATLTGGQGLRLLLSSVSGGDRPRIRRPGGAGQDDLSRTVVHLVIEAHGGEITTLVPGTDRVYARISLPPDSGGNEAT